ncbi:hypothetical protein DICA4_D21088 [Diutina catenulata]
MLGFGHSPSIRSPNRAHWRRRLFKRRSKPEPAFENSLNSANGLLLEVEDRLLAKPAKLDSETPILVGRICDGDPFPDGSEALWDTATMNSHIQAEYPPAPPDCPACSYTYARDGSPRLNIPCYFHDVSMNF